MTKKKKNKHKSQTHQLPQQDLEQNIVALFRNHPNDRFDVKQVAQRISASNPYQVIEETLNRLRRQGVINLTRSGKFKLKGREGEEQQTPDDATNTIIGTVDMTRRGDAYVVTGMQKGKDIFVPGARLKGALNGDTVRVRWKRSSRGRPEGSVVEIIQRKTIHFVGTLNVGKRQAFVTPDDPNLQMDIWVDRELLGAAQANDKVVVAIRQWANENPERELRGEIVNNLGKAGSNNAEMQSILIQNGFNIGFPEEVVEESEALDITIPESEIAKRRDFRSILTFTIDPADAKDFDDAISFQLLENGNHEIGVHIADVSHYVRPGMQIDLEASRRTTSVYLVDRVAPMLPEKLSNGVCSLRPNEDKLTFSAVFEITPQGKIVKEWFGKTVIHSARRYAYEEVQEILEAGKGDYHDALKAVNAQAQYLRKERFKRGAINFESTEVKFRLDENGKPLAIVPKIRKEAHFLIEEFMLLANRRVAAYIDAANTARPKPIPFVYRIHDLPDMEKVENFIRFAKELGYDVVAHTPQQVAAAFAKMQREAEGQPEMDVLQQLGIRTMAKAAYSTDNIGHYGLAFPTYSHFTSPIRRYADLLAHRVLFEYLQHGTKFPDKDSLEAQCKHISVMERRAMDAERESVKYKQAEFMQEHIGELFEGIISGITEYGIYVEIIENYCEGMVRFDEMYDNFSLSDGGMHIRSGKRQYKMGDKVWVSILNANPHKRQIDMRLMDETKVKKHLDATTGKSVVEAAVQQPETPAAEPKTRRRTKKAEEAPVAPVAPKEEAVVEIVETPKEEVAVVETTPTTKRVPVNRTLRALMETIANEYVQSDAAKLGGYFTLSETALRQNRPVVVTLCGEWQNDPQPPTLENLSQASLKTLPSRVWHNIAQSLDAHFAEQGGGDQAVVVPFCPYRYHADAAPSRKDLQASRALFDKMLGYLKPTSLLIFSTQVRAFWLDNQYLSNWEEKSYTSGKRTVLVGKGIYTYGKKKVPVYVLPHPNAGISQELRQQIWKELL